MLLHKARTEPAGYHSAHNLPRSTGEARLLFALAKGVPVPLVRFAEIFTI
jgi:hypothetical protein